VLPARIPPGPAGSVRIPTSGEYVVVTGLSLSNVDTGNSLVWILASFQFMQSSIANSGGLQCALRIDGTTIPETVTGTLDTTNDRWGENMMADTGNTTTGGIAFVLDAILDVTPGRHTIEVVAKSNKPADIPMMLFGDNVIDICNRELVVIVGDPSQADLSGSGVSLTPLAEGDSLTAASLNTPLDTIENEVNDLDYTAIRKESLHDQHLASMVITGGAGSVSVGTAVHPVYTNNYSNYASTAGWVVINDGATDLEVIFSTPVDLGDADVRGILVLLNGLVTNIRDAGGGAVASSRYYAVVAIQVRDTTGTYRTIGRTERFINSERMGAPQVAPFRDVPIRAFITSADMGATLTVDRVRAVVTTANWEGGATDTEVSMRGCNLTAIALQAG